MKYLVLTLILVSMVHPKHDHRKCKWRSIDFAKIAKEAAAKTDAELRY
jgi:hypothetical protein